jgi:geranylgeranyl pyrophosphate synthase
LVQIGAWNELVRDDLVRVEAALAETAQPDDPFLGPLLSTVLPGSGKRLRPSLALLIGRLGESRPEPLLHMATGVELLHAASLVHDDVVDESELRRGSQTLFTRVGNSLAVLVGDYLFAQSASRCVATENIRVIGLFAQTLGSMTQGQIAEASRGSQAHLSATKEGYLRTIWGKTASLFVLACEGSAILAGLTEPQVQAMRRYGDRLGLAFQVVDDVLDFVGDESALGKRVGSDLRQGTITLPIIYLREALPEGDFRAAFDEYDVDRLVRIVRESPAIDRTFDEAERLLAEARDALLVVPAGEARDALETLTRYVVDRRV